ncbi:MAG: hypothetical protein DLM62_14265 [Pseudonocardiales bacterium]|nr:MAG: hypothetical protein DLM62_14265 [Pseudonocardiales bacterium]
MTRSLPGTELTRQYLLALCQELGVRGVTCALRNIGEDVMLQVHDGNGVTCGDDPGDTVTVAVISGQWWYCWPETMVIGPVSPPARAAQAIIDELEG